MKNRVVPLPLRHKNGRRGDQMEPMMHGNTLITFVILPSSPEEIAQAEYDLHMAAWAIIEEAWEKGEAV